MFCCECCRKRSSAPADTACKEKPVSLAASSRDLPWQPVSVISAAPGEVKRRVVGVLQHLLSLSATRLQTSTPTPSGHDPAGSPPAAALRPGCLGVLFLKKKSSSQTPWVTLTPGRCNFILDGGVSEMQVIVKPYHTSGFICGFWQNSCFNVYYVSECWSVSEHLHKHTRPDFCTWLNLKTLQQRLFCFLIKQLKHT